MAFALFAGLFGVVSPVIGGERSSQLLTSRNCPACQLADVDLTHVDLRDANLQGAQLRRANLSEAELDGADLGGGDLSFTSLQAASLRGADLRNSRLMGTDLRRADLTGALLDQTPWTKPLEWSTGQPRSSSHAGLHNAGLRRRRPSDGPGRATFQLCNRSQPGGTVELGGRGLIEVNKAKMISHRATSPTPESFLRIKATWSRPISLRKLAGVSTTPPTNLIPPVEMELDRY